MGGTDSHHWASAEETCHSLSPHMKTVLWGSSANSHLQLLLQCRAGSLSVTASHGLHAFSNPPAGRIGGRASGTPGQHLVDLAAHADPPAMESVRIRAFGNLNPCSQCV